MALTTLVATSVAEPTHAATTLTFNGTTAVPPVQGNLYVRRSGVVCKRSTACRAARVCCPFLSVVACPSSCFLLFRVGIGGRVREARPVLEFPVGPVGPVGPDPVPIPVVFWLCVACLLLVRHSELTVPYLVLL